MRCKINTMENEDKTHFYVFFIYLKINTYMCVSVACSLLMFKRFVSHVISLVMSHVMLYQYGRKKFGLNTEKYGAKKTP